MRIRTSGIETAEQVFDRLGRNGIRRIVEAGGRSVAADMQRITGETHRGETGVLMRSARGGRIYEGLGSASQFIDFEGDHGTGITNHDLAYILDNGRGGQGDRFITGAERLMEKNAIAAMQAESDRMLAEIKE